MSALKVYKNPPITEAVLDIFVQLSEDFPLDRFDTFYEKIKGEFSKREKRIAFSAKMQLSAQGTAKALPSSSEEQGYIYRSEAQKSATQARLDGFTFNKLRPYENWENFRNKAMDLWKFYDAIACPLQIKRIALRYINRIEIPIIEGEDLKEYIHNVPEGPKIESRLVGQHFLLRLALMQPDTNAFANIIMTLEPASGEKLPLILDIEVYKVFNAQVKEVSIREEFENLRKIKNDIFSDYITEKAEELFK